MDIITNNLSDVTKNVKNVTSTIAKPLTVTGCAAILSKLFYESSENSFLGLEIPQRYAYTGCVGLTSWGEASLRQFLLPTVIGEKLSHSIVDLTSPFVVGLANLLLNQGFQFYNFGTYLSLKGSMYAFTYGFVSEVAGIWLYNNVVKALTDQMLV